MFQPSGLYGHIRRNTLKSALLLVAFGALVCAIWYTACVLFHAVFFWSGGANASLDLAQRFKQVMLLAANSAVETWWIAALAGSAWLAAMFFWHAALIRHATGARPVTRSEQPKLYGIVETLAVAAGLPTPRIEIMASPQLNAYAAGLGPDDAVIAVTRGLLAELEDDELEAVLAHEMAHIRNRDVRLMVIASLLASGLSLVGGMVFDAFRGPSARPGYDSGDDASFLVPAGLFAGVIFAVTAILVAFWLVMAIALFAVLLKFAISRSREFLADAGAVELTKNPDALIAALQKISGRDEVPVSCRTVQAMLISFDSGDLFDTHPSIADRISALQRHAGGQIRPPRTKGIRYFGTWGRRGRSGLRNGGSAPIRG